MRKYTCIYFCDVGLEICLCICISARVCPCIYMRGIFSLINTLNKYKNTIKVYFNTHDGDT